MGNMIVPKRKLMRIDDIIIAKPKQDLRYQNKAFAAEPTGKGETLILDSFFGRIFRSDVACVKDELSQYHDMYEEMCQRMDEDPAHQFFEVLSWNDLYYLHGIIPGVAQGNWGYTNSDDYRVPSIDFETGYVEEGPWVEMFGESYFYYCPRDYCVPDPCYMEV